MSTFAVGVLLGLTLPLAERASPRKRTHQLPMNWRDVVIKSVRDFGNDRIPAAAAAVTFYVLLALFPALSAFVSLYSLVSDPGQARGELARLAGFLPSGALDVLGDELSRLTAAGHGALSLAFVASLAVSIWSANAGVKALIDGLNVAYEARETRGFIRLTLLSLALTFGGIVLAVAAAALLAVAPAWLDRTGLPHPAWLPYVRWPALLIGAELVFSVLFRLAPNRAGRWRWITPGACVAAAGWLAMSGLFSWYVSNFGHYNATYGSLGAIVGFLTWIWLSLMVLMFGAELNDALEARQSPA
jgi:membrane protein